MAFDKFRDRVDKEITSHTYEFDGVSHNMTSARRCAPAAYAYQFIMLHKYDLSLSFASAKALQVMTHLFFVTPRNAFLYLCGMQERSYFQQHYLFSQREPDSFEYFLSLVTRPVLSVFAAFDVQRHYRTTHGRPTKWLKPEGSWRTIYAYLRTAARSLEPVWPDRSTDLLGLASYVKEQTNNFTTDYQYRAGAFVAPSRLMCQFCGQNYSTAGARKQHELTHLPPDQKPTYDCQLCGQKFSTRYLKSKHKLTHLPPDQKPTYDCQFCDKNYNRADHHKQHEKRHMRTNDLPCTAPSCKLTFLTHIQLTKHLVKAHPALLPKLYFNQEPPAPSDLLPSIPVIENFKDEKEPPTRTDRKR